MKPPLALDCAPPFLVIRFDDIHQTLGWSITRPGFQRVREITWLEVRDDDLSPTVDTIAFLKERLASKGLAESAAFMTARDVKRHHLAPSDVDEEHSSAYARQPVSKLRSPGKAIKRGLTHFLLRLDRWGTRP